MLPIALCVAVGVLVYANALHVPFVFDDAHAIVENSFIRSLWPPLHALAAPPQSALSGRPLVSLSLAINYAIGGLAPAVYHGWNIAVHVAAALLLFAIVRRHIADRFAWLAALIWLVHPLQTEVIDYATQRTESMMGLLYLATFYAAIRGWNGTAVAACALGMATKESMVTAPIAVLAYDVAFGRITIRRAIGDRPWLYAGLASTWVVLFALNASGPRSHTAGFSTPVTPPLYALNQARMIATYLRLTIWPHPLILDYGPVQPMALSDVWPSGLAIVAALLLIAAAWRRYRAIAFLGTFFFLTLAPTSSVVPIATEVGAERRMYLPLAAAAVLFARSLRALQFRSSVAPMVVGGAVVVVLAAVSIQRNAEYRDPILLWTHVVEHRPHGRARHALGFALQQAGRRQAAIAQYRLAAAEYPLARYNLALQLAADGRIAEAIDQLRARLRIEPSDADTRGTLADLLLRAGQYREATIEYAVYLRAVPSNAAAHNNLGLALVRQNRIEDAVREFRTAVALSPTDSGASQNLARALRLIGSGPT